MAVFDAQSNRRIIRSVLDSEQRVQPGVSRARNRRPIRGSALYGGVGITSTAVSGFNDVSLQAGSGEVQRYKLGDNDIMEAVGDPIDVKNMARAVDADKWVQWKIDEDGVYWLDVELCPVALASNTTTSTPTAVTVADLTEGGIFGDEFSNEFG